MFVFLMLFNLMFSECDIVVDKSTQKFLKTDYLVSDTSFDVEGIFFFDGNEFYKLFVKHHTFYDIYKNEFIVDLKIQYNNVIKECKIENNDITDIKIMEDSIRDCLCEHSGFYYFLEKVLESSSNWGQTSQTWRR